MSGQTTTSPPITLYSVKGNTLTYNEVDNNFSYLSDSIDTLNAFNGITNFALLDSTQTFTGNNIFSNITYLNQISNYGSTTSGGSYLSLNDGLLTLGAGFNNPDGNISITNGLVTLNSNNVTITPVQAQSEYDTGFVVNSNTTLQDVFIHGAVEAGTGVFAGTVSAIQAISTPQILLYNNNNQQLATITNNSSAATNIVLPSNSGSLALTSDIASATAGLLSKSSIVVNGSTLTITTV